METGRRPILQGDYKLVEVLERQDHYTVYLATSLHNPAKKFSITRIRVDQFDGDFEKKATLQYFRERACPYVELLHPGLTTLKDFFFEHGCEYLVFDHCAGDRLSRVMALRNRPFTEPQAVDIALQIARILEWMHELKSPLYFSDLTPWNVILMPRGRVRLTEFGLPGILAPRHPDDPRMGTKGYAPPEQSGRDAVISRANDVYALGILMHQMVTGEDPTVHPGVFADIGDINPSISEDYREIVARATQPDPALRYRDVREFLADLKALEPSRRGARESQPTLLERLREVLRRPFVAA